MGYSLRGNKDNAIITSDHGVYSKRTCTEEEVPLIFFSPMMGEKRKENLCLCLEIILKVISFSLAVSGSGK